MQIILLIKEDAHAHKIAYEILLLMSGDTALFLISPYVGRRS